MLCVLPTNTTLHQSRGDIDENSEPRTKTKTEPYTECSVECSVRFTPVHRPILEPEPELGTELEPEPELIRFRCSLSLYLPLRVKEVTHII